LSTHNPGILGIEIFPTSVHYYVTKWHFMFCKSPAAIAQNCVSLSSLILVDLLFPRFCPHRITYLQTVYIRLLTILLTSVEAERAFSAAGIFNSQQAFACSLSDHSINKLFSACLLFTGLERWFQLMKSTVVKFITARLVGMGNMWGPKAANSRPQQ